MQPPQRHLLVRNCGQSDHRFQLLRDRYGVRRVLFLWNCDQGNSRWILRMRDDIQGIAIFTVTNGSHRVVQPLFRRLLQTAGLRNIEASV